MCGLHIWPSSDRTARTDTHVSSYTISRFRKDIVTTNKNDVLYNRISKDDRTGN